MHVALLSHHDQVARYLDAQMEQEVLYCTHSYSALLYTSLQRQHNPKSTIRAQERAVQCMERNRRALIKLQRKRHTQQEHKSVACVHEFYIDLSSECYR